MKLIHRFMTLAVLAVLCTGYAVADDQTVPGKGNATAIAIASRSPLVASAMDFLQGQAKKIRDNKLRKETQDALFNQQTCIKHRAKLTEADKDQIVATLIAEGLVNPADGQGIVGGVKAGVFPPVLHDGSSCPTLPQTFFSSPGSVFDGHHSYPGGLPVHESNNETADVNLASEYRSVYGSTNGGWAVVDPLLPGGRGENPHPAVFIDEDIIVGAPLWHDWAKPMVFQWNADGSEFVELNFGGNGSTDAWGAPGDSRTGGHHIIGVAEAMKRGLDPAFVITQASAHSAPTSGNEYKVVNWLRAAAIIAGIDPVQKGYLTTDSQGRLRLPVLRSLGSIDMLAAGQMNLLAEYTLHNLSDADFTYSGPAISQAEVILAQLAPKFGYNPNDKTRYNTKYRNVVLSFMSGERILMIYSDKGVNGVAAEVKKLRDRGII